MPICIHSHGGNIPVASETVNQAISANIVRTRCEHAGKPPAIMVKLTRGFSVVSRCRMDPRHIIAPIVPFSRVWILDLLIDSGTL